MELNSGQLNAVSQLHDFFNNSDGPWAMKLEGEAGTGKTTALKTFLEQNKGKFVLTAPTNKATKVLKRLTEGKAPVCTTYSLLGLRMTPDGEVKKLTVPDPDAVDLDGLAGVIVDEASMVNSILMGKIKEANEAFKVPFLFVGDLGQLPPVGEPISPFARLQHGVTLDEQMRNAGPILRLAQRIREQQNAFLPSIKLDNDIDDNGMVLSVTAPKMCQMIIEEAEQFLVPEKQKIISWRNVKVDEYNGLVRKTLFGNDSSEDWLVGERVILTEPAKDFLDSGQFFASTDDEGTIQEISRQGHPLNAAIDVHRVKVLLDTNKTVTLFVLCSDARLQYLKRHDELLNKAKAAKGRYWADFWDFKESFHSLRHAYAITAHRSQGSTYDSVFVDWRDILRNPNRKEAYQCLYVAETRAKRRAVLG